METTSLLGRQNLMRKSQEKSGVMFVKYPGGRARRTAGFLCGTLRPGVPGGFVRAVASRSLSPF